MPESVKVDAFSGTEQNDDSNVYMLRLSAKQSLFLAATVVIVSGFHFFACSIPYARELGEICPDSLRYPGASNETIGKLTIYLLVFLSFLTLCFLTFEAKASLYRLYKYDFQTNGQTSFFYNNAVIIIVVTILTLRFNFNWFILWFVYTVHFSWTWFLSFNRLNDAIEAREKQSRIEREKAAIEREKAAQAALEWEASRPQREAEARRKQEDAERREEERRVQEERKSAERKAREQRQQAEQKAREQRQQAEQKEREARAKAWAAEEAKLAREREQVARKAIEERQRSEQEYVQAQRRREREEAERCEKEERQRRAREIEARAVRERPAMRESIRLFHLECEPPIDDLLGTDQLEAFLSERMGDHCNLAEAQRAAEEIKEHIYRLVAKERVRLTHAEYAEIICNRFDGKKLDAYVRDSMADTRPLVDVQAAGEQLLSRLHRLYKESPEHAKRAREEAERKRREDEQAEIQRMRDAGMSDHFIEEELAAKRHRKRNDS
jgi:hypothetical protein